METKLERIANKSKNEEYPIFTSLYHLINIELLKQCHKELDGNKAVGIDNISKKEYSENLDENIEDLVTRLKNKSYKPLLALRVYIPKGNGKMRLHSKMIANFRQRTIEYLFKILNKRSNRKSYNWEGFTEMLKHYKLPNPKIYVSLFD